MLTTALSSTLFSSLAQRGAAVCVALFKPVTRVVRAILHRSEIRELASYDERMLKDIGLTRGDVISALSEPLGRDPSLHLVARTLERPTHARRAGGGDLRRVFVVSKEKAPVCDGASTPKVPRAA